MQITLPTPVRPLTERIWVKDEGGAHPAYGGNKVRKLERVLAHALEVGATDLLTVGGIGSHHVVATAVHGAALGLRTHALLFAQPDTPHVRQNALRIDRLCASTTVLAGATGGLGAAARHWARIRNGTGRAPCLVQVGGSSAVGTCGWIDAGLEIADQVRQGLLPAPARIYVALGSGGTAAGLLVGLALAGLRTEVVAVRVVMPWIGNTLRVRELALRAAVRYGRAERTGGAGGTLGGSRSRAGALRGAWLGSARLRVDPRFLCGGYGRYDARVEEAMARGGALPLETTYTAKALAAALADDRTSPADVLFVQTAPAGGPAVEGELPPELDRLLLR